MIFGPFLYIRLSRRLSRFSLITANFIVSIVSGILVCAVGRLNPYIFAIAVAPISIMGSFVGPPSRFLLLTQQEGDTGTASSLIGAVSTAMGSLGMLAASLGTGDLVILIGVIAIVINILCGAAWLYFTGRPFLKDLRG
jgi:DHA1 family bicyclomycin/chloramphenicol resistance-like MFS transporter